MKNNRDKKRNIKYQISDVHYPQGCNYRTVPITAINFDKKVFHDRGTQ